MTTSDDSGADWRDGLAQRLTVLAMRHSQVSLTFPVLRRDFRSHLDRLDPASNSHGELRAAGDALGAWLAKIGITGEEAVRAMMHELGVGLLNHQRPAGTPVPAGPAPADVVELMAGVAAGYGNAVRLMTFEQQEHIKRAMLQAKRDVERELHTSETRFREVFASAAVGIAISDLAGIVVQSNPALQRMVSRTGAEIRGTSIFELFAAEDADALRADYQALAHQRADASRITRSTRVVLPDSDTNWVELSMALLRDQSGAADHYATIFSDVSDLYLLTQRLRQQTLHDMVTNRPNRQFLVSRLEQVVEQQDEQRRFWLYHLDLDGFAAHNNRFGRVTGDQLMRVVAERLEQFVLGERAMLARSDGDQFLLLLEQSGSDPHAVADELLAAVHEPIQVADSTLRLTASIGIAMQDTDTDAEQLLRQADLALRRARELGGAQAIRVDPDAHPATITSPTTPHR